jgi:general secretion pathway protein J
MNVHPPRSQSGFTLVEVMIALALLLGMATAMWTTMATSFETKERVSQVNERYHEGRQVMTRMARELRMAFIRAEVPEEFREEKPAVLTRFKGDSDEIYFASTSHLRIHFGARESDQSEIAYFLGRGDRESGYRGKTLYRRESKRLDGDPEKGGFIWPVLEGVKRLELEYWDDEKEIGDDAWQSDWDSHEDQNSPLLPARVRITIELETLYGGKPIRFVTQAAPQLRRPVNVIDSQVPGRKG